MSNLLKRHGTVCAASNSELASISYPLRLYVPYPNNILHLTNFAYVCHKILGGFKVHNKLRMNQLCIFCDKPIKTTNKCHIKWMF